MNAAGGMGKHACRCRNLSVHVVDREFQPFTGNMQAMQAEELERATRCLVGQGVVKVHSRSAALSGRERLA